MPTLLEILLRSRYEDDGVRQATASAEELIQFVRTSNFDFDMGIANSPAEEVDAELDAIRDRVREDPPELTIQDRATETMESVRRKWDEVKGAISAAPAQVSAVVTGMGERVQDFMQISPEPIVVTLDVVANGLDAATSGLERMQQLAVNMPEIPPLVNPAHVDTLRALAVARELDAQAAQEQLRAAIALGESSEREIIELAREASGARAAADAMVRLTAATKLEALAGIDMGMSLKQQVVALKASKREHEVLAESYSSGNAVAQIYMKTHEAMAASIQAEIGKREALINGLKTEESAYYSARDAMEAQFSDAGITKMSDFNAKVKELKASFKEQRRELLASGDAFKGTLQPIADQEQALNSLVSQMVTGKEKTKLLGKEVSALGGVMGDIMGSAFNQLGFVMFITENTIKSLVRVVNTLTGVFTEGADSANMFRAQMMAMNRDLGEFNKSLQENSGYTLDLATSSQEATFFLGQYGDEFPGLVDKLAQAARSIVVLGGSQEEANKFFSDQLNSLHDLSPAQTRYGQILFDTTSAQDEWNISAALGNELLDTRKRISLADTIISESDAIIAQTEDMDAYNTATDELTKSSMGGWTAIKAFLGSGLVAMMGGLGNYGEVLGRVDDATNGFVGTTVSLAAEMLIGRAAAEQLAAFLDDGIRGVILQAIDAFDILGSTIIGAIVGKILMVKAMSDELGKLIDIVHLANDAWFAFTHFDLQGTKDALKEAQTLLAEGIDFDALGKKMEDAYESAMTAAFESGDQLLNPIRNSLGVVTDDINNAKSKFPQIDISSPLESLNGILEGTYDLQKNLQAAWDSYNKEISDINSKRDEDLKDLQDKYYEDLLNAGEEFQEKSAKAQEDYADKLLDIDAKLALDEFRTQEDAEEDRERARKANNKKQIEIEEAHQKKMKEIMRKFDLDRLKALIDRDARALYEAERRRDEDLKKEQEAAEKKKNDARDDLGDKLADIDAAEKKKLDRMREDADIERRAALKDYKDKFDDLQKANADELEELEDKFKKRRNKIKQEAFQDKIDAKKEWNDAKNKLIADLKEKEHLELLAQLQLSAKRIQQMQDEGKDASAEYAVWNEIYTQAMLDHNEITKRFTFPTQGLGDFIDPPPTGGPGGSDPDDGCAPGYNPKFNPALGGVCSQITSTTVIIACDGSRWQCYKGNWIPAGTVTADVQQTGDSGGDGKKKRMMSFGTDVSDNSGGRTGSNGNQVTIVVEGDKTLEQIFREISFSAYIETIT